MSVIFITLLVCFVISLFFGRFRIERYPRYTTVRRHARKGTWNGVRKHSRRISDGTRWIWVPHDTTKKKINNKCTRVVYGHDPDISFKPFEKAKNTHGSTLAEIVKSEFASVDSDIGHASKEPLISASIANKDQIPAHKVDNKLIYVESEQNPFGTRDYDSFVKPEKPIRRSDETIDEYHQRVLEWDDLYNASLDEIMNIRNYDQRLKRRIFGQ